MKAIVLGGSRFVGSHVADALTLAGHEATVFDNRPSPYLNPSQRFIQGDILDAGALAEAIRGHDVVYNFAGFADLEASVEPAETVKLNVRGEPIVCTPEDSFRCFMGTEIDLLAVGNCLLDASRQDPRLRIARAAAFAPD